MRAHVITVSASAGGNSHSDLFVTDPQLNPFNIGFGCAIATTCHYTIQHTFDNPFLVTAAARRWYPHEFVVAASGNTDGNYAFPVAGIRVEASSSNEGGVSVTLIQAGVRD
jgi:hypothetical protein